MNAIQIIQYSSAVIWSLPPFRQYKGNFFYYFLFVAIADPLTLLLSMRVRLIPSNFYYLLTFLAALVSVISIGKKIRWKLVWPVLLTTLTLGFYIPNWDIAYIICVILFITLYYFIRYMIIFAAKNRYISLFHFLFLIYNASLLIKLINAMVDPVKGLNYYFFTTIFDTILGILFCIFREENTRFALKLKNPL